MNRSLLTSTPFWVTTSIIFTFNLIVVVAGFWLFPLLEIPPAAENGKSPKTSGALQALEMWRTSRAFPEEQMPQSGYAQAFEYSHQALARNERNDPPPWESMGPKNVAGRALAIDFNHQNPTTIWLGSASGGLWKTTTAGIGADAWEYISTGFPVRSVAAVAVHPTDSNTVYIGTGEVYRYQDATGGLFIRTTRGSYGLGVLKTADGGATWSKVLDWSEQQLRGVQVIKIDPQNPETVWAGTTEGVYKTTDGGGSWALVSGVVMVTDLLINPNDPNRVVIVAGNQDGNQAGCLYTIDGGITWSSSSGFPANYTGKALLAQYGSNPDIVMASVGDGSSLQGGNNGSWLCRSTDGGHNWTVVNTEDYTKWQGWFSHDVLMHPEDSSLVIAVGVECFRSTDAGQNLTQVAFSYHMPNEQVIAGDQEGPPDYVHADVHAVEWAPGTDSTFYLATDGGLFCSTDGGLTFESRNGGLQTTQFYQGFASHQNDSMLVLGGLQDNGTVLWDGTTNWTRVFGGDGTYCGLGPVSVSTIYASYQNLSMIISHDSGGTWSVITPPFSAKTAFIAPYVVDPQTPEFMYAGRDVVFKTTNAGQSWTTTNLGAPLAPDQAVISMAIAQSDPTRLYAATFPTAGQQLGVFRTSNSGGIWDEVTNNLPNRVCRDLYVNPQNPMTVYAVLAGFGTSHLWKSVNRGNTWTDIGASLPDVPASAVAVDPLDTNIVYFGNDLGVYVSSDGGQTWTEFNDGLPDAIIVRDLSISPSNRKLWVATHGNGAYRRSMLPAQPLVGITTAPAIDLAQQPFPNPFSDRVFWSIGLEDAATVSWSVRDLLGVEVVRVGPTRYPSGELSLGWDGRNAMGKVVAPGNYLLQVNVDGRVATSTIVRQ